MQLGLSLLALALEYVLVLPGPNLESVCLLLVDGLQGELLLVVLEQGP